MQLIFWCAAGLLIYTFVLFPAIIVARGLFRREADAAPGPLPMVSVLIAAHNEENYLSDRINNILDLDYPADRLEIIVASDGSEDATEDIARGFAERGVKLLSLPRGGKCAALNAAFEAAAGSVLVFTDANTVFAGDAVRALVAPLSDPEVGGVAGDQIYVRDDARSLTADGELAYWSFDRAMKELQSRAGNVTSATGAIYAIRRDLFEHVPLDVADDFQISTGVVAQGYKLKFARDAKAFEPVAVDAGVEYQRKVRVATQGLRGVVLRRELFNPLRFGFYSIQLFSHKVLRRLSAVPMLALLLAGGWLWRSGAVYQLAMLLQAAFYALAVIGFATRRSAIGTSKAFSIPFYFCMVHTAALVAALNVVRGARVPRWTPERYQPRPVAHMDAEGFDL